MYIYISFVVKMLEMIGFSSGICVFSGFRYACIGFLFVLPCRVLRGNSIFGLSGFQYPAMCTLGRVLCGKVALSSWTSVAVAWFPSSVWLFSCGLKKSPHWWSLAQRPGPRRGVRLDRGHGQTLVFIYLTRLHSVTARVRSACPRRVLGNLGFRVLSKNLVFQTSSLRNKPLFFVYLAVVGSHSGCGPGPTCA